jgi:hypothetical protein
VTIALCISLSDHVVFAPAPTVGSTVVLGDNLTSKPAPRRRAGNFGDALFAGCRSRTAPDEPCSATKQRATGGDLERPASEQGAADHATHEPQRRSASEHPADRDREIDELAS